MTRKIPLYLGATALALVLGAPAYAQVYSTIIENNQSNISVDPTQIDHNSAVVFAPGVAVSSFASQAASTTYNQIGGGNPTDYVTMSNPYQIVQAAGTYLSGSGTIVTGTVLSVATNVIGAGNDGFPAVSNVAAGGNQSASNVVNDANFAPELGTLSPLVPSVGSLTQVAGAVTEIAANNMFAVVFNGTATVQGTNGTNLSGFQIATDSLNTGGVFLTPAAVGAGPATDLTLTQKLTAPNTLVATNSAIANSTESASLTLDPSVKDIAQSAGVTVNELGFVSGTTGSGTSATPIDVTATLDGAQNGITEILGTIIGSPPTIGVIGTGVLTAVLGNTAVAYTGPFSTTYNLFTPTVVPAANGAASVTGVTQNAQFGLNNVFGSAGVSLTLTNTADTSIPPVGFLQTVDGANLALSGPDFPPDPFGNVYPNVINGIVARSDSGSASITGVALTSPSQALTQSFTNQQNVIAVGGALSGYATQTAVDINPIPGGTFSGLFPAGLLSTVPAGYYNVAVADVNSGPATITNVSQGLDQTLNYVSAGTSPSSLTLNQVAGGLLTAAVTLGSNNVQLAVGTTATISGASQGLNTTVNYAALPGNGATTLLNPAIITQTATNVAATNNNLLAAYGNTLASVSGAQSASSSVNTAVVGSMGLGTVMQTATNVTLTNTNTVIASSMYNASSSVSQSAISSINVVK